MSAAELVNIVKHYPAPAGVPPVEVLRGVDLQIAEGESVAIVGPSGCGKSTLLNLLGTLDRPDSGSIRLCGEDVSNLSAEKLAVFRAENLGFIFQLHHLLPQCTALENVLVPTLALPRPASRSESRERAERLLRQVGLGERLNWKPDRLSGGERQRVAVVRALINKPRLLLADEPTGALDELNAALLTDLLLDLQREEKTALVLVTHHPAQAAKMGRVLTVHEGKLI